MTPDHRPLRTVLTVLATLLLGAVGVLTAGTARADDPAASGATPPGSSWIRAGHFVPGFGAARVDLFPQGDAAGSPTSVVMSPGAAYGDVTSYQKIEPRTYTVQVRAQGEATTTAPLLSRSFTVDANTAHTIAVVGDPSSPRLVVLDDDLTPPAAGTARVRVLDASAAAQNLTVQAVGGPTLAQGAVLGQVTPYVTVPQGDWNLQLSGGAGAGSQQITVAGGSVYTAVALDSGAQPTVKVLTDAAGSAAMPTGAAATGLGGLAGVSAQDRATAWYAPGPVSAALAVALLLAVAVLTRLTLVPRGRHRAATHR